MNISMDWAIFDLFACIQQWQGGHWECVYCAIHPLIYTHLSHMHAFLCCRMAHNIAIYNIMFEVLQISLCSKKKKECIAKMKVLEGSGIGVIPFLLNKMSKWLVHNNVLSAQYALQYGSFCLHTKGFTCFRKIKCVYFLQMMPVFEHLCAHAGKCLSWAPLTKLRHSMTLDPLPHLCLSVRGCVCSYTCVRSHECCYN